MVKFKGRYEFIDSYWLFIVNLKNCELKKAFVSAVVIGALALVGSSVASALTGNGAPSGAHYNLNLIGVPKDKTTDMTDSNGHRIFVPLNGKTKILLTEGEFAVVDANGTDGTARFQLPNPDEDGDGTTSYSVFVKTFGKPRGKSTLQSCYTFEGEEYCAVDFAGGVDPIELTRSKGKSSFENVTRDLLYVDVCYAWDAGFDGVLGTEDDVCTDVQQVPLFGDDTLGYLWDSFGTTTTRV